jgi:hypothetical protein
VKIFINCCIKKTTSGPCLSSLQAEAGGGDTDFVSKFIHYSTTNHNGFDGSGSWHKTEKSISSYLQVV